MHIPVRVTCSTCCPWKHIWPTLHRKRVMVLRNLCLLLLLKRSVMLLLVKWVSYTQHCSPYTLGN